MIDFKPSPCARHAVRATALLSALLLAACGGGGGNPGATGSTATSTGSTGTSTGTTGTSTGTSTGTTVTATPTVALVFANASGAATTSLTSSAPLTVKATVLDASKKPVSGAIVTFATDNTLGAFTPTAGTALTDANGVASVTMRVASLAAGGAATVTASASVAGATVTGTANYAVSVTALAFGALSASPAALQAYGSTTLSVDLLNGSSKYTDQSVDVSFSSACVTAGKATLATTVPTVNGTAQTVYRDKGCGQNDIVTVSASGVAKQATATLAIAAPAAASVQFVSATPSDKSIVIAGQGGNGRTETATLTFKAVDIFGNALPGKAVNFTTASPYVKINKTSDTTDASGTVVTTVNSMSTATSFRVLATLPGTGTNGGADISTLSDSIVVTTGQPVQRAFSLSAGSLDVEGWNRDSSPTVPATTIQALLADTNGNPVPDGTPIVFQTNVGSVGSSNRGGCNTVNGGCSVDFRAQAPRVPQANTPSTPCNTADGTNTGVSVSADNLRPGLATICASTSDGTNTLAKKITIFLSSSSVGYVYLNGSSTALDFSTPYDLGTLPSNASKTFTLQINDVNLNPMPAGTTVAIVNASGTGTTSVAPSTVPNISPHTVGAGSVDDPTGNLVTATSAQGSTHVFSISSASTITCPAASSNATFSVSVTTPAGLTTTIPFKLSFSCL